MGLTGAYVLLVLLEEETLTRPQPARGHATTGDTPLGQTERYHCSAERCAVVVLPVHSSVWKQRPREVFGRLDHRFVHLLGGGDEHVGL